MDSEADSLGGATTVDEQGPLPSASDVLSRVRHKKSKRKRERSKSQPVNGNHKKPSKDDIKQAKKKKKKSNQPSHDEDSSDDDDRENDPPEVNRGASTSQASSYANVVKGQPSRGGLSKSKQPLASTSSESNKAPKKKQSKPVVFKDKLNLNTSQERKFRNLRSSQERLSRFLLHQEYLQKYDEKSIIPNALKLNLPPALGKSTKEIDEEWEDTLHTASHKLLKLTLLKVENSVKECKTSYFQDLSAVDNDQSLSSDMKTQIKERSTQLANRKEKRIREQKNLKWARATAPSKENSAPGPSPSTSKTPTGKKQAAKPAPQPPQKGKATLNGRGGKKSKGNKAPLKKNTAAPHATESETNQLNLLARALQKLIQK